MDFKVHRLFLLVIVLLLNTLAAECQPHKDKVVSRNGKKYYIHIVTKGETVYGVSKDYSIEVRDIVLENPHSIDGISPGDTLQIPVTPNPSTIKTVQNPSGGDSSNFIYHKVEAKETLYSLCKQYGVKASVMDSLNPALSDKGLRAGMTLRIPKKIAPQPVIQQEKKEVTVGNKKDTTKETSAYKNLVKQEQKKTGIESGKKQGEAKVMTKADSIAAGLTNQHPVEGKLFDRYNVALMLPFMNEEVDSLKMNKLLEGAQQFPLLAQISSDFYEGSKIAVDSFGRMGMKVNLFVYNIPSDSSDHRIDSLLKRPAFQTMNLIIGPPSPSHFKRVASFALKHNIPIVSPLSPDMTAIHENNYASKAVPSPSTEMEQCADYIVSHFKSSNILVVHNRDAANNIYFEVFNKRISAALSISEPRTDSMSVINYTDDLSELGKKIDGKRFNIIVVPYQDASFVSKLLNQLSNSKYAEDDSLCVFGMHNWTSIDVLDVNNLDTLHFHFPTNECVDYANPGVAKWVQNFRNQYFTEPSSYAMQGFDVTFYFLSMLKKFGTAMQDNLSGNPYAGVHTSFDFHKPNPTGGMENKGIFIMEYKNYYLQKDK